MKHDDRNAFTEFLFLMACLWCFTTLLSGCGDDSESKPIAAPTSQTTEASTSYQQVASSKKVVYKAQCIDDNLPRNEIAYQRCIALNLFGAQTQAVCQADRDDRALKLTAKWNDISQYADSELARCQADFRAPLALCVGEYDAWFTGRLFECQWTIP